MMEEKIKFIIIGLSAVLIASLLFNLQTFSSKQAITRQRDNLKEENVSLVKKAEDALSENSALKDKISLLNQNMDQLSHDKEDLQRKLDTVEKSRNELVEQLKSVSSAHKEESAPQTQDAYWGGILRQKKDLELQLASLRNELKTAQINNEQLQREKATLELDVTNLKRDEEDLRRQLDYNQKVMDGISQELVREKNDKTQIQDSFKLLKNENSILTRQLKSLNIRKINLDRQCQELQEEKNTIERRLNEMETMLASKASQIEGLKDQVDAIRKGTSPDMLPRKKDAVELSPIVVKPQSGAGAVDDNIPEMGKIISVNRDNNFVVVDLGEDSGAKIGDAFRVYNKEGKIIGAIEVIEVRKTISACDIRKESQPLKVGDIIR